MARALLGFLSLVLLSTNSRAETFRELMENALANNPEIQQQEENQRIVEAQLGLSYSSLYPTVTSSLNAAKDGDGGAHDVLTLRADQLLFDGGTEYSEIAKQRRLFEVEKAKLEDAKDLVRYEVTQAALNGAFAREKLRILQSSRETQLHRLEELRRRFRLGQSREPDLIQAEVEFQKIERFVIDANGLIDAGRRDLSLVVRRDFQTFDFPELDALIAELRTSPLIVPHADFAVRALQLQVDAARMDEKKVARSYLPTLKAYAQAAPYRDPGTYGNSYEVGLQAQWTLFEGFKAPNEMDIATAARRKLEIQLEDLQYTRKKNLGQLKIDRQNTIAKLKDLKAVVARAEKALRLQQADYRRGLVTAIETQASIQNVLDLNLEQAELRLKMGQLRAEAIKLGELQ